MIEEYNDLNDDADCEPISLTNKDIQNLLNIDEIYCNYYGCEVDE